MARKTAVANMFEPAPVRRSRRIAGTAVAARTEKELLAHIAGINDLGALEVLRAQMDSEGIPKTKAVKDALDEQRQAIMRDAEENVSPNAAAALRLASRRARRPLMRPYPLRFGNEPGPLRKSKARRTIMANDWARAIAEEEARLTQENAVAPLPIATTRKGPRLTNQSRQFLAGLPPPPEATGLGDYTPLPDAAANAAMNALAARFGAASLGPRSIVRNQRNPYTRNNVGKVGVPGYHGNWGGNERSGGRRKTRKIRAKRGSRR